MPTATFPQQIEVTSHALYSVTEELRQTHEQLALITAEEKIDIALATNPDTGKLLFTNETTRDAALIQRLRDHEHYNLLKSNEQKQERAKADQAAKLERLRGEFKLHLLDRREAIATTEAAHN